MLSPINVFPSDAELRTAGQLMLVVVGGCEKTLPHQSLRGGCSERTDTATCPPHHPHPSADQSQSGLYKHPERQKSYLSI